MCPIPSTSRPNSNSSPSGQAGDFTDSFAGKDYYKELIDKANSVPLAKLFKYFSLSLDANNRKIICPFKSHKGGRESTPSFTFYPDTNSFYCYGCNSGSKACDFVSKFIPCTKVQAAYKIFELFEADIDEDFICNKENFSERLTIMMDFSNAVLEFHQTFVSDKARIYVEELCKTYDALNLKHKLDNEALKSVVDQLKEFIKFYKE